MSAFDHREGNGQIRMGVSRRYRPLTDCSILAPPWPLTPSARQHAPTQSTHRRGPRWVLGIFEPRAAAGCPKLGGKSRWGCDQLTRGRPGTLMLNSSMAESYCTCRAKVRSEGPRIAQTPQNSHDFALTGPESSAGHGKAPSIRLAFVIRLTSLWAIDPGDSLTRPVVGRSGGLL